MIVRGLIYTAVFLMALMIGMAITGVLDMDDTQQVNLPVWQSEWTTTP